MKPTSKLILTWKKIELKIRSTFKAAGNWRAWVPPPPRPQKAWVNWVGAREMLLTGTLECGFLPFGQRIFSRRFGDEFAWVTNLRRKLRGRHMALDLITISHITESHGRHRLHHKWTLYRCLFVNVINVETTLLMYQRNFNLVTTSAGFLMGSIIINAMASAWRNSDQGCNDSGPCHCSSPVSLVLTIALLSRVSSLVTTSDKS